MFSVCQQIVRAPRVPDLSLMYAFISVIYVPRYVYRVPCVWQKLHASRKACKNDTISDSNRQFGRVAVSF